MASNKEIVGWFTRGGKRIPIFKGEAARGKAVESAGKKTWKRDALGNLESENHKIYAGTKVNPKNGRPGTASYVLKDKKGNTIGEYNRIEKAKARAERRDHIKRGEGKLTPYYYDSKLGQYHTGEKFNSDAVNADIKEQTRSRTTEHTTTRKARVRSARRKKDGR